MISKSQSTDLEFALGVLFVPIFALVMVGLLFVPIEWIPRCWLYDGLGIPCPACGSYRALQSVARGDVIAGVRQQPFMVAAALGMVSYSLYAFLVVFGRLSPIRLTRMQRRLAIGIGVLFVAADWVYVFLCQ